jgi:serine/threonine protein kinase
VWEAILDRDNKRYALKVLRPEQRGNKDEIAFLKHEFEVAKELNHKNIIKLIEYRTDAETPFIVLELFSEMNLKMAMRRGPEPIAYKLPPKDSIICTPKATFTAISNPITSC